MSEQQPDPKRIHVSIAVVFGWLLFLALWLFFYAISFSILQNIAIFLLSLIVAGILLIVLWLPWSMKHTN
jgi:hypothetical protein